MLTSITNRKRSKMPLLKFRILIILWCMKSHHSWHIGRVWLWDPRIVMATSPNGTSYIKNRRKLYREGTNNKMKLISNRIQTNTHFSLIRKIIERLGVQTLIIKLTRIWVLLEVRHLEDKLLIKKHHWIKGGNRQHHKETDLQG